MLGASYRGGVKEMAFSGVFPLVAALRGRGYQVALHDPMYSDQGIRELAWEPYHVGEPADPVVVQADHAEYAGLLFEDLPACQHILDGRQVLAPKNEIAAIGRGVRLSAQGWRD